MKKYQTDKAERETERAASMETVSTVELARVAEPEFQYGAEAFEAYQIKESSNPSLTRNVRGDFVKKR